MVGLVLPPCPRPTTGETGFLFPCYSAQMAKDSSEMNLFHAFLAPQSRGIIQFPPEMKRRLHLDQPGAQLEVTERPDGVFELRATLPIPADEAWFWTDRWQAMEREADEDIAAGRVTYFENVDDFIAHLESLDR